MPSHHVLGDLRRHFRYRPLDLWRLLRTNVGRRRIWALLSWIAWPVLGNVAALYRRTVLRRTPVIAVVGSFGKSTTARALLAVLDLRERQRANSWSFIAAAVLGHRPGRPLVLEVGISRRGQMRKYARALRPSAVVFTSIGSEHSRSLGDLQTIANEKACMLRGMIPGGVAFLNGDDALVMAASASAGLLSDRIVTFGISEHCEFHATGVAIDWPRDTAFTLRGPGIEEPFRVQLVGPHGLRAAVAAAAVAQRLGVPSEIIAARLDQLKPGRARMEPVFLPSGAVVLRDDIKSGLQTIYSALDTLASIPARRRLVVLGGITEPQGRQKVLYREVGARAATVATRILYLGNRYGSLVRGVRDAGLPDSAVTNPKTVQEVAAALARDLGPGDVVLVKGRSSQKLGRIALLLKGEAVACSLTSCHSDLPCESCDLRVSGWGTRRAVT
jgi:UDP-N-acetylmuramyl pentapeptide synthase